MKESVEVEKKTGRVFLSLNSADVKFPENCEVKKYRINRLFMHYYLTKRGIPIWRARTDTEDIGESSNIIYNILGVMNDSFGIEILPTPCQLPSLLSLYDKIIIMTINNKEVYNDIRTRRGVHFDSEEIAKMHLVFEMHEVLSPIKTRAEGKLYDKEEEYTIFNPHKMRYVSHIVQVDGKIVQKVSNSPR